MEFSKEENKMILDFFDNNQIFAECFLQLFDYQKLSVPDVELEFRDGLVGFKRKGEKLRLYIIKDKNGVYRIKIKVATSHVFMPAEMINYQSDIDKNNFLFEGKKQVIKTSEQKLVDKKKNSKIRRVANKKGIQHFLINNLSVDNIQPILDCIAEFRRDGIKNIRVRITEIDKK